jgi:hypothetical protein
LVNTIADREMFGTSENIVDFVDKENLANIVLSDWFLFSSELG